MCIRDSQRRVHGDKEYKKAIRGRPMDSKVPKEVEQFKAAHPLAVRKEFSTDFLEKYPDAVPVIILKSARSKAPKLIKQRFLFDRKHRISVVYKIVRENMEVRLNEKEVIYLTTANKALSHASQVGTLYDKYKDDDGLLYFVYQTENAYGA
eukprot:TRINITY_DN1883_c0_g1_i12.p1 TRINITY_DN1883_c0_g1~~TRINITY_DN1883_c0_g1_i12.p1  ORF type:complete len:151 (-),score=34.66 TRINITY_DN1883_c0_g1_i12:992-1444(-)